MRDWYTSDNYMCMQIETALLLFFFSLQQSVIFGLNFIGAFLMIDKTAQDKLMMHNLAVSLRSAGPSVFFCGGVVAASWSSGSQINDTSAWSKRWDWGTIL